MAGFDLTAFLRATSSIEDATAGKMGSANLRMPYFGAADALMSNAPGLIRGLAELKKSTAQPVAIPVFNKIAPGTETIRKCAGSGHGESRLVPVVWQPYQEEFMITDLETQGNQVTAQESLNYHIREVARNIYGKINTDSIAFLETNKATVNAGNYFGAQVGGATVVPFKRRQEMFAGVDANMASNNYTGITEIVASQNMRAIYGYQNAQGTANGQNLRYQLDNVEAYFTNMAPSAGAFASAYAFEQGTVGLFPWLRQDFVQGSTDGAGHVKTTFRLPAAPGMEEGLLVELLISKQCVGEAVFATSYIFHVEVAYLSAYAQTTGDSGIYKINLMPSEDDTDAFAGQ